MYFLFLSDYWRDFYTQCESFLPQFQIFIMRKTHKWIEWRDNGV